MFLFAPRSGQIYVMRLDLRGAGTMMLLWPKHHCTHLLVLVMWEV
jgi:hypothetical protein